MRDGFDYFGIVVMVFLNKARGLLKLYFYI